MIRALERFVGALRDAGISVSPAEMLDASRAIDCVGLQDRARFRAALRATLAKGRRASEEFDRLFDRFFSAPGRGRGKAERRAGGEGGRGDGASGPRSRPGPADKDRSKVARPAQKPRTDPARRGTLPAEDRERVRRALARADLGENRREGRLRGIRIDRKPEGKEQGAATRDPMRILLAAPMSTEEERRLADLVPKIVEEIRLRKSRRLRRAPRGRLWMRRVFRENLTRGGVPFVLPGRKPRRSKPRVVLLVDVSHSVARASAYFLRIASAFLSPGRQVRVLAFVDRPVDATAAIARWVARSFPGAGRAASGPGLPGHLAPRRGRRRAEGIAAAGVSFADVVESLPGLDPKAPSDYGRAFYRLLDSPFRPSGTGTVLVVLGDARTNRFDPLAWALEEVSSRCRTVLWLNPEPRSRWGTSDSAMADYLPHVDTVVEAKDLAGLARGVAELLRRM